MLRLRFVFFVCALAGLGGCAYRTRPTNVPEGLTLPAAASDVSVTVRSGAASVDADEEASVRAETERVVRDATTRRPRAGHLNVVVDLQLRATAYDVIRRDGLAVIGLAPAPLGMITERERLGLEVTFTDEGGRVHRGRGAADVTGGIYAPARRKALALALERALVDAATR